MIEANILKALQTAAINAFATTDLKTVLNWIEKERIAPMGITLDPKPADGRWIEFRNIPNNRADDYYGDERVYQGNFRILLHWTNEGAEGVYKPTYYIDQFGDYFKKNMFLGDGPAAVKIYQNPSAQGMIENGAELIFPLTLPYRCFRP